MIAIRLSKNNKLLGGLTFILILGVKTYIFYETSKIHGGGSGLTFFLSLCILFSIYYLIYRLTKNMVVIIALNVVINGAMIIDILYNKYVTLQDTIAMGQMIISGNSMTSTMMTSAGLCYLVMDIFMVGILSFATGKKKVKRLTDKEV